MESDNDQKPHKPNSTTNLIINDDSEDVKPNIQQDGNKDDKKYDEKTAGSKDENENKETPESKDLNLNDNTRKHSVGETNSRRTPSGTPPRRSNGAVVFTDEHGELDEITSCSTGHPHAPSYDETDLAIRPYTRKNSNGSQNSSYVTAKDSTPSKFPERDSASRLSYRTATELQSVTINSATDTTDFWDNISQYSLYMPKNGRYYFQHPYARLFVAYFVVFCNFLCYAEDPVAHSKKECFIPAVGNAFSLVGTYYPPNAWSVLKVFIWLVAIIVGLLVGKLLIHKLLLNRLFKLRMFEASAGSWMIMFLLVILMLFVFSFVYNLFLMIGGDEMKPYHISQYMGISNSFFMKAAACGTWLGDFFTAWMVTDIMLQEKLYPNWAVAPRRFWKKGYNRIILFWIVMLTLTILVVTVISTDIISWDTLNRDFLPTNEMSRAILASFILVMDLLIVMQDWDFPHFVNNFDIKLPGLNTAHIKFEIPKCLDRYKDSWTVHITGKWFNYGIIFLVMILDLNMWKNQIFYSPFEYGQYTDTEHRIWTVTSEEQLNIFNETLLTFAWRSNNTNPQTNATYLQEDGVMNSQFLDIHLAIKAIAFIPSIAGFIIFGVLIYLYGRRSPTRSDPYAGRMMKRTKKKQKRQDSVVLVGHKKVEKEDEHSYNNEIQDKAPDEAKDPEAVC